MSVKSKKVYLNYNRSGIADSNVNNKCVKLSDAFFHIKNTLDSIESNIPLKLDLSENYIRDEGFKELYEFIINTPQLHLAKLNLRSNYLTENSFILLTALLQSCPNIKIDVSFNNISLKKFKKVFSDISGNIIFKPF